MSTTRTTGDGAEHLDDRSTPTGAERHGEPERPNDLERLVDAAASWMAQDPDPETRAELSAILDGVGTNDPEAVAALRSRFGSRLGFGTAGLRGEVAAGPNRMNRVLVSQAAAGLAAYLLERAAPGVRPSVVIGYDGRRKSDVFARDTAEIMAGAGVRAVLLPRLLPTPLVAYAVRDLGVSAGVMVTASHNPPRDNGYKVYLGGDDEGSQIVPPADADIAAHIERVAREDDVLELPRSGDYEVADEALVERYVEATAGVATSAPGERGPLRVVYTAMHGVGWETLSRVLVRAGFEEPVLVEEQIAPDSAFPTVVFPNPEEVGALDLAYAYARESRADLILANDPDADRLGVAIPDRAAPSGFRRLTGNEVGQLLGWRAAERAAAAGVTDGMLSCSIVSSPGLRAVAEEYGLGFVEALTGFKWISRVPSLVFGYEEALGYLVNPGTVRDKDGISAAVAVLDLASTLAAEGRTLADRLDDFVERFGAYGSSQISLRVTDLSRIRELMAELRATPPTELGDFPVVSMDDLAAAAGDAPTTDALRFDLGDARVMVRPSGTEPKLKVYVDAWSTEGDLLARKTAVAEALLRLEADLRARIS
ncbi:phosphomannomutase [Cnuibacter physcomitrellae]|uniref:Phosphomannomutase n=2 Tax=Cnuibacter physcomitrellae TaxID=1619308 RepID=A0A1X9LLE2_9MICO|nr:phosphomannomutase [Cnuibacter physcomitrellae]GGI37050.1 phosphomannomutase [Cnuibacter physcomitrellae]